MGALFFKVKNYLKFNADKKSTTLSGAVVFFILLGVIPLSYLTSLVLTFFGTELTDITKNFSYPELVEVTGYIYEIGLKLGAKGNIIAFVLALYSSGNIFYQLKLSGELIYNYSPKNNLLKRVFSIITSFIAVWLYSCIAVIFLAFSPIITRFLGGLFSGIVSGAFSFLVVLSMAILINLYTCPYKLKVKHVIWGSFYTAIFTFVTTALFFLYINNFASFNEIYGKIAIVIVFLSWLYLMVKGFIGGITLNVYVISKDKCNNILV